MKREWVEAATKSDPETEILVFPEALRMQHDAVPERTLSNI
jgi:hypothetical protein